jgi:hypothetical protein
MEKEIIRQTQMITQNKAETARQMGITRKTVDTVLKQSVEDDKAVQEARRQSAIAIAGKVHGKVDKILEAIMPEDLVSGHNDILDDGGKKVGQTSWGPSLLQKVTAGAILIDKLPVLAGYQSAISEDHASGALPLPNDIRALVSGIQSKIRSISVLNVRFAEDNPDLSQRAQEIIAEAEIIADNQPPLDFDNPGVSNGETDSDHGDAGVQHAPADSSGDGVSEG